MYLSIFLLLGACSTSVQNGAREIVVNKQLELRLDKIVLPDGFRIEVYADDVEGARSLCLAPDGTLFVGSRGAGNVYALRDTNQDFRADLLYTLVSGMRAPNGVAFKDGDLYFAEISKVWVFRDILSRLNDPGEPELVYDDYPTDGHHGWKYIAFGPDGWLYIPVGAPCNICESEDPVYNTITRLNVETKERQILHTGIRNTVGFDWHPVTGELWFTDNGADWLGDNMPACELNYAPETDMHFGYPYCHQGDFPDPEYGAGKDCSDYTPPAQKLGPHVAPLGMEFYTGDMFPEEYANQVLIAEHGSWNRSVPIGYRVTMVKIVNNTRAVDYTNFAEGWLQGEQAWGRPVDLELLPDGSLLVSDDYASAIYRITYDPG